MFSVFCFLYLDWLETYQEYTVVFAEVRLSLKLLVLFNAAQFDSTHLANPCFVYGLRNVQI